MFLQSVLAASGDCIKVCDLDGSLIYMNDQGLCLMEADFEALRGKVWPDLWPAEAREDIVRAIDVAKAGGTARFTGFCPTAKGAPKWWEVVVTAAPGADGRPERLVAISRDITERQQAERESAYLGAIVQNSDDAVISKTLDGVIKSWNNGAQRLFGYSAEEAVGQPITILIPPDRLNEEPKILEQLKRGERVDHFETKRRRKDGVLIDISLTISPVRDSQGRIIGASKVARDITERKKAEAAVRESEQASRRALDYAEATLRTSPVPLLVLEGDLRVHTGNDAFFETFQVSSSATEGLLVYDLGNGQWNIPRLRELLEDILPNRTILTNFEVTHDFQTIGRRTMLLNARRMAVKPDGAERIILVIEDITRRKQSEIALQQSEERFRTMADNIAQLAWTCDKLGEVTWYNKRWLDYTGLSFEEMKDWGWKQVHDPDHVDRVVAGVARARESGEPWEDTFPLRGKDGEYRWFLSRAVPVRDAAGVVVRWFGTNTDITERLEAEETQRMLSAELTHRVKNMLATVQAIATQTLRQNSDPTEFVASFGARIQSMSRMHSLLSSGGWQGADLRDVIRDQLLLGPIDETRVTAWGPAAHLDRQLAPQIAMILHELGTNSIKYGALSKPSGVVTISWSINDAMLQLRWTERGGPPAKAPTRRGFGTLFIEQSAKALSGSARMSVETTGVNWEIALPMPCVKSNQRGAEPAGKLVKPAAPPRAAPIAEVKPSILAEMRLLVVEDEPLVALDMISSLEEAGAVVTGPIGTGAEALAVIESVRFDAALLDGNLHGQPVDEIAAALTRRKIPFVFVTGYGRESLPRAFRTAPMLTKPFSQAQLLEAAAQFAQTQAAVLKLRD